MPRMSWREPWRAGPASTWSSAPASTRSPIGIPIPGCASSRSIIRRPRVEARRLEGGGDLHPGIDDVRAGRFREPDAGRRARAGGIRRGTRPAFFSWLGVVPYLTRSAAMETLRFVGSLAAGSGIVFDYALPPESLNLVQRLAFNVAGRARGGGRRAVSDFLRAVRADERAPAAGVRLLRGSGRRKRSMRDISPGARTVCGSAAGSAG